MCDNKKRMVSIETMNTNSKQIFMESKMRLPDIIKQHFNKTNPEKTTISGSASQLHEKLYFNREVIWQSFIRF